ncbi:response regulator [Pseudoduganella plicata]|uniref:histidine kinase n=1 Tax=Pseudoduganella plicata TaxID=321984 RepID=A0A4P7BCC1_9BURK|nr:hybrid sensor histidine kinase/response regulator [Pseudoduganella plicata]QBQ36291.1 hybrid sensor histidine kinase/response regulator [Pseudoduganella plicata]GGY76333.1 hybrid sensor histidine kinase/response regulator [Pseudoduganella plicata]
MSALINILVVDDVPQNLIAIEALLARPGIALLKAASGAEALELLLVHEVALALVDVQMPNMDGFELAELIRGSERTRSIPLIFLTAASREPSYSFRGYEAGAVDFLYKPIDPKALTSKVNVFVELYQQKKQLSQQLDDLRRALHMNEMFMAVLGHDLRTPLSVVMNGAMLLPMMTDHPKVAVTAQRIQSSARRMTSMVDQLLDLARIRAGEMQLKPAPQDIGQLCRTIADEFTVPERASRVQVTHSGDPVAPVDGGIFAQALSNLLGNALQHGEADGPVTVQIDGRAPDRLSIAIGNRGVIPAERLAHIFEPFQHRDGARKSGQGLGLGLYTASTFVRAHGGHLAVASDAAGGTTVLTVTLPRPHAPRPADAGTTRSAQRQMA